MAENSMFSKAALERLRSPEKLDTAVTVTSPVAWMGLLTIAFFFFAVLFWSIFGAFTENATGCGLIMDSAGVVTISPAVGGKLTKIYVQSGTPVHVGDLIARLDRPDQSADTQMAQYSADLAVNDRDVRSRVYQYGSKRYQEAALSNVYSDYDGVVDEVMAEPGNLISYGSPLCSVRLTPDRDDMTGVFYIPLDKGKRVKPGMTIQLVPNGVDVTQTGSLIGVVRSVSQYPISGEGVRKTLGNSQLAQYILNQGGGAAIEVTFDLVKDPSSESGYLWTSIVGEHKPVTPGSYCTGTIVIDRKPPIEKVFYKFSQWLRSR